METITLISERDAKSPIVEAYRAIRTNIQFAAVGKKLQTIVLTSAAMGEGKSTTTSNLAVVMAQAGHRVLLLDCDMRHPTQHKIFQLAGKGLTNCLSLDDDPANYVQGTNVAGLYVLPSGPIPPNPSELLGSKKMQQILEKLREQYDYILLDTPPLMPVTDAAVAAAAADGVILLVSAGAIAPSVAKEAKQILTKAQANIIGVILNKVELEHTHGYYYYSQRYGDETAEE